jgi:hypothetical protein
MSLDTAVLPAALPCAAPVETLSGQRRTTSDLGDRIVGAGQLEKRPFAPVAWLWHGYLAPGKVTLLTSQWKSGKTTLLALLLARLQQGGEFVGLPVAAGKALIISEESEADWQPRCRQLGIRDNVDLLCRPFLTPPGLDQWLALIETALDRRQRHATALVAFDSLAHFLPPHCENSAGALLPCLTALQRLTTAGLSVLLLHHPSKGRTLPGQSARGCGALPAFVDILLEMSHYTRPDDPDRRRRLVAYSRHPQTVRHRLIELSADGSNYQVVEGGEEPTGSDTLEGVLQVLSGACTKMTRQEIQDEWLEAYEKPTRTTLWRCLNRASAQGLVHQQGTGRSIDPFRYWLPEREPMLRPDGGTKEEMQAWNWRIVAEALPWAFAESTPSPPAEAAAAPEQDAVPPAATVAIESPPSEPPSAPPPPAEPLASPVSEPDPLQAPAAEPIPAPAAEPPVSLPWPWSLADPADVPAEVWQRARDRVPALRQKPADGDADQRHGPLGDRETTSCDEPAR